MKKITLLIFILISFAYINAQTVDINFDATSFSPLPDTANGVNFGLGYMNWFDNPKDGNLGVFQFDSGWGIPDLVVDIDTGANTAELKPNRIGDPDPYWQSPGVLEGNKIGEANFYIEDDALVGNIINFSGRVISNTLDDSSLTFEYTHIAFIKIFAPDYSSFVEQTHDLGIIGDFTITIDATDAAVGSHVQYGFTVTGPNINSDASFNTDYANLGGIVIGGGRDITSANNGNWNDTNTWTGGIIPLSSDAVELNHDVTVDTDAEVYSITVTAGNQLSINAGNSLTVVEDLGTISSAPVILNSTSSSYASLIVNGSAFAQNVIYNRYVNSNTSGNDLIAPPVDGQSWSSFLSTTGNATALLADGGTPTVTYAFAPFNKTTGAYENFDENTTATLTKGRGYRVATDSGETLAFTGPVFTDDVNVPITNVGPSFELWNLIGNPYPSYIRLDEFLTTNSTQLFNDGSNDYRAVYGYNANSSDQWTIWNSAYSAANPDALITPGQGFFVAAAGSSSSISFTKSMRSIGTDDDFIINKATNTNTPAFAKFNLSYDTYNYGTDIYFIEGTTQGLDSGYDTNAFNNNAAGIFTALVQNSTNEELAIQSLPYSDLNNVVVPVGVKVNAGIQATISLNDTENTLPSNIFVYLEDNETNTWTLLNDSDYMFTTSAELTGVGRFFLRFSSTTLSSQDFDSSSLSIFTNYNNKTVVVKGNLVADTLLNIFDIHGRVVLQRELDANSSFNSIPVENLNTGIYVLKLENGVQHKTQKIIIK